MDAVVDPFSPYQQRRDQRQRLDDPASHAGEIALGGDDNDAKEQGGAERMAAGETKPPGRLSYDDIGRAGPWPLDHHLGQQPDRP